MTTDSSDREFEIMERGYIRDLMLDYFRAGLRQRINPETGALFTEDDIAQATGPGSRWYRQAEAEDDIAQGEQRKALFINDQLRINRACTAWLEQYHGPQWSPEGRLPATPGSGKVLVTGVKNTMVVGSTSVPDETAYWGRSATTGVRVQVFGSNSALDDNGNCVLTMIAMDSGTKTNLRSGDVIVWSSSDPNMAPQATVVEDWTGGFNVESDAAWSSRMEGEIRHRQGGGNDAQNRALARGSSNAAEDVFIYACAFDSGSFLMVPVQKRGGARGPMARYPSDGLLSSVRSLMVPPGSPVSPSPPRGIVLPWRGQSTDVAMRVSLARGSLSGFTDQEPFPNVADGYLGGVPVVSSIGTGTFNITAPGSSTLPGVAYLGTLTGAACPKMMYWDSLLSRWAMVSNITAITQLDASTYSVAVSGSIPFSTGTVISPRVTIALANVIAEEMEAYFDARGPGELYAENHDLGARCVRFPERREQYPSRAGADMATEVIAALNGAASDAAIVYQSRSDATLPTHPFDGPNLLTLGNVGVYPF